ncbi:MAG: hypothetical protein FWD15_03345 [Alphaproteobacteria bacterium]|nr:hypothetical protein [Alphaproteobacteria bacterium]
MKKLSLLFVLALAACGSSEQDFVYLKDAEGNYYRMPVERLERDRAPRRIPARVQFIEPAYY